MRLRVCLTLGALLSGAAFGQTAETTPKFEAADLRSSPRVAQPFMRGPFYGGGRYETRFATMLDLISMAYGVDPEKISGGPNWLEMDRFDLFALAPQGSNAEARKQMLQALLADRFALKAHRDTRPLAALALTAGKHPLLKDPGESGDTGCKFTQEGGGASGTPNVIRVPIFVYTCHNTTMATFAAGILDLPTANQYFGAKPVVDQTGLTGAWDFVLRYTPKIPAGLAVTGENIPLPDAFEKQLGLKLESATVPVPMLVVDSVNRKPTPNDPDIASKFPPVPTEFDVAEIKPSLAQPDGRDRRQAEIKNGRIYIPGISLKNLIQVSWDLNGDEFLIGAPKWMDDDRYDLIAKAPAGVAIGELNNLQRRGLPFNLDALRPMIQALVVERFKLVTHKEERPLDAYVLLAGKPKLKKSDPNTRTKWEEGAAPETKNSKNSNATLGRLVTCHNVTMAEFAELLPAIAPGYLRTEVADKTGMEGGYDFTFSFSPIGALRGGRGGGDSAAASSSAPAGAAPEGADLGGTVSLFESISQQLGLKLETHKRPMPVLVIDSVLRKPVE